MNITLNRQSAVPIREQIVMQLELQILAGALAHGQRLPSVRSLARRLAIHHNTVSSAYQDLQTAGHVVLQPGSGVFIRRAGPKTLYEAKGVDEMIRLSLGYALSRGFSVGHIREAVERWIASGPPRHVLVVDPSREMGELLVEELRDVLGPRARSCTLDELRQDPTLAAGALVLVLPYHVDAVRECATSGPVKSVTLEVSEDIQSMVRALPPGSIVLVVSHAPTVLPFASVVLRSLRGDDVVVEAHTFNKKAAWRRLLKAADLVLADALSAPRLGPSRPRKVVEFRVISADARERVRHALQRLRTGSVTEKARARQSRTKK